MHGPDAGALNVGLDAGAGVASLDAELPVFAAEGEAEQPAAEPVDLGGADKPQPAYVPKPDGRGGFLCSQNDCGKGAVARFTWPGRPELLVCREHSDRSKLVAKAMGFELQVIELAEGYEPPPVVLEGD